MASSAMILRIFLFSIISIVQTRPSMSEEDDDSNEMTVNPNSLHGPFTAHFKQWLEHEDRFGAGVEALNVFEKYGPTGSFGGKKEEGEEISRDPVIFIHGNSDSALDYGTPGVAGWTAVLKDFQAAGYKMSELYGITYGNRKISLSLNTLMSCEILKSHRKFVENVLNYTESPKVDIIGHSMGATIARKIVKGGLVELKDETCDLGPSIADKVDTLIALAGAHYGMCLCGKPGLISSNACNVVNGFYASQTCGNGKAVTCEAAKEGECRNANYGEFLKSINQDTRKEADHVYSLWSKDDQVLGNDNLVWGKKTSFVPGSKAKAYTGLDHFNIKTGASEDMISLVQTHTFAPSPVAVRRVQRSHKSTHKSHHHKKHQKSSHNYEIDF